MRYSTLDRRQALFAIGAAGALVGTASIAAAAAGSGVPATSAVTDRPRIDTLTIDDPYFNAAAAFDAGMNGAVVDLSIYPRTRSAALDALETWRRTSLSPHAGFRLVSRAADFSAARNAGKFAVLLACQDAQILDATTFSVDDTNLENMRELHLRGLRMLQLTHNDRNAVGDSFMEVDDAGLSRLGRALVPAMAETGMIVDLSHCSDRTTGEAIALSPKPVAVTHAGCRALFSSARNKPDAIIRALAQKGGYFGVFQMTRWLVTDASHANVEAVVDHIAHAANVGGIDCVGFGSDRPVAGDPTPQSDRIAGLARYQERNAHVPGADPLHGHESAADLENTARLATIDATLARRGFAASARDKILGQNFVRLVHDVCG